ncbi:hypothetical protein ALC62_05890 [Cyphomyrmex costatus]|uniref:Uncharacterized protein n=1 Tax=Cyphomyrmex costatus TaxID=456900 RepID=A0A195CRV7_9HYME|nr:hypothetical protein ALC62_05890 [Cyphomyrmex costatus]
MTVPPLKDNGGAACAARRSSSVVIPRPVDRPVSHGLKRSVEVLIRVSDRVPRPLITEPDLIRCPPTRFPRRTRAMRNRSSGSGDGGVAVVVARGVNPTRFKPFDECPPDDHREFAVRANESTQVFRLYQSYLKNPRNSFRNSS